MLKILLTRFLIFICFFSNIHTKVLIFDLGGVLVDQHSFGMVQSIGFGKIFKYYVGDFWRVTPLKSLLFKTLNTLGTQKESEKLYSPEGQELPEIMVDWLKGIKTPHEIADQVTKKIDELDAQSFFVSRREKKVIKQMVSAIFDPGIFAENTFIIDKGKKLVADCLNAKEKHTLVILSNWDAYSFTLLKKKHKVFFDQFDLIVISGEIGVTKPHKAAFATVLNCLKLKGFQPNDCYFIDDQKINVEAAVTVGIHGLWLKNGDYSDLRKQMLIDKIL